MKWFTKHMEIRGDRVFVIDKEITDITIFLNDCLEGNDYHSPTVSVFFDQDKAHAISDDHCIYIGPRTEIINKISEHFAIRSHLQYLVLTEIPYLFKLFVTHTEASRYLNDSGLDGIIVDLHQ